MFRSAFVKVICVCGGGGFVTWLVESMFLIYLLNNFFQAFSCEAYTCGVRWWRCMEYVGGEVCCCHENFIS